MSAHSLPPWLQPPEDLGVRSDAAGAVASDLGGEPGVVWVVGPPGCGVSATAAAVARQWPGPVRAARLTPCRTPADVVLALGEAVGALPPGDEASLSAALAELGPGLVLLDDADRPEGRGIVEQLQHMAPELRWLLTGRRAPPTARAHALGPVAGVAAPALPDAAWLPPVVEFLALTGVSLRGAARAGGPNALAFLPCEPGRQALRRSVAEALRARSELEPARVAAEALPDLEPLLALATGAPLGEGLRADDALALRWLGDVLADPDASCRASAAAARLFAVLGQQGAAQALLDAADRRNPGASPGARALVAWARADLKLDAGELDAAETAWAQAAELLQRARDLVVLAAMLRRQADRLAARGHARQAARCYRTGRALHLQLDDPSGVAATVRGTADLAVAQGEVLSAEMLYDEADATAAGIVEASNRRLGRAGLALAQGDLARARRLLDDPEFDSLSLPLVHANRDRRRAELALREGHHEAAEAAARRAADAYARLGERAAEGRTLRLLGDIAAASGRLAEAAAAWQRAVEAQVRSRDLAGLRRTLEHMATLEESDGDPEVAVELREAMGLLALAHERSASGTGTITGRS